MSDTIVVSQRGRCPECQTDNKHRSGCGRAIHRIRDPHTTLTSPAYRVLHYRCADCRGKGRWWEPIIDRPWVSEPVRCWVCIEARLSGRRRVPFGLRVLHP